ncbi:hypothetical protein [Photobacterium leiognathi]|uniref:hypothetical protein n=1 Tax=Photobacterium leiognathi TaxID=553611 RepID=UPI00298196CA|nr:hypothetical protein [Photobacterium leiognathi]
MKGKAVLALTIGTLLATVSFSSMAARTVNVDNSTIASNHTQTVKSYSFENDAVNIDLSKADQVKAKNFGLTNEEYAKYKYLMEYTPRGKWTKDIDPVVALGVSAKTQSERMKYARLMYEQRKARTQNELAFSLAMMKVEHNDTPNDPRWKPWAERRDWILKKTDPDFEKDKAVSHKSAEYVNVFVDPSMCLLEGCKNKMRNVVKSKLSNTEIQFVLVNANHAEMSQFKRDLKGQDLNDISFTTMNESSLPNSHPKLPFMFISNPNGKKLVDL